MSDQDSELSIGAVVVLLMLVIAAFGWAFAAAGYAHAHEDWGSGVGRHRAMARFVANAFSQLPNLPAVVKFTFSKRLWLVIVILVLEGLALLAGLGMKKLERDWNKPPRRRR